MKFIKILSTLSASLIIGGCTGGYQPPTELVDCTGFLFLETTKRTYTIPLSHKRVTSRGDTKFYIAGYSPFTGTNWVDSSNFSSISCK